ncbi:MAG: hypothetical protein CL681_07195 [Blastopirellula sp.]|nr:hypothetical protein [Blastopirellula sp.]
MAKSLGISSRWMWFLRGFFVGVLVNGTCNAVSYFVRSQGWGALLGDDAQPAAIGFPLQVWHSHHNQHVYSFENPAFLPNLVFSLSVSLVCGITAAYLAAPLDRLIATFDGDVQEGERFQFSLRGMLLFTLVAAVASMVARGLASSPYALGAIYLLGPVSLVVLAMLPRGLRWQQRVVILGPGSLLLIILAVVVGLTLDVDVEKILLGIYVCWTPQSFLAAVALTLGLVVYHRRVLVSGDTT